MKTKSILVVLLALCTFGVQLTPAAASGAIQLTDHSAIFLLDFGITASYGSFGIPVLADSTVTATDRVDVIGYNITNGAGDRQPTSQITSLVLGNAPLMETRYTLATSTAANFTLMIVATFVEPITEDLTATITKFPFWVDGRRTTLHANQLADFTSVTLEAQDIAK